MTTPRKPADPDPRQALVDTVKELVKDGATLEDATRTVGLTVEAYKDLKNGKDVPLAGSRKPRGRRPVALGGRTSQDDESEAIRDLRAAFEVFCDRLKNILSKV